ncbi:alkaline phosphatase PhoX [Sulfitobacter sp.]|uniref:alkaline phosphatase PhoX n=1 Tax=Sulfitobacter sp. TaxID=1903071 RepID=UPI0030010E64
MIKRHLLTTAAVIAMLPVFAAAEVTLTRIATMPDGAEVTGISTNAIGDLFLNAQHPGGKNTFKDDAPAALVGYVAGFDPSAPTMSIPAETARDSVHTNSGEYVVFAKAGDTLGNGQVFGGVYDAAGELMYVSNTPDFNGFVPTGANTAYLYTGWEGAGRDGASAVSKVSLTRIGGKWTADLASSKMLDLAPVDGGAVLCSGIVTPWGTPLLAEEYFFYNSATWNHPDNHDDDERASFQGGNDINYIKPKNMSQYIGKMANPYRYGYMIEINNAASANAEELVKHYATGRLSHETAAIMPDNKTIYMTDDDSAVYSDDKYNTASGGVLFKFVTDVAGDLSEGTLFAAKLAQDDSADPTVAGFDVTWVELGHSNNAEIETWITEYDNVQVADYVEGQTNYVSDDQIRAHAAGTAPDSRAAFLESRRTAAAMGATNEWDKLEGVTSHGKNVYLGVSALSFTMDKSWGHKDWSTGVIDPDVAGAIALNAEGCGATYVATTGDDYNITRLDPYVVGKTDAEGRCDADLPANPDNILTLNDGTLLIGEDAGKKRHDVDMLWMVKN